MPPHRIWRELLPDAKRSDCHRNTTDSRKTYAIAHSPRRTDVKNRHGQRFFYSVTIQILVSGQGFRFVVGAINYRKCIIKRIVRVIQRVSKATLAEVVERICSIRIETYNLEGHPIVAREVCRLRLLRRYRYPVDIQADAIESLRHRRLERLREIGTRDIECCTSISCLFNHRLSELKIVVVCVIKRFVINVAIRIEYLLSYLPIAVQISIQYSFAVNRVVNRLPHALVA